MHEAGITSVAFVRPKTLNDCQKYNLKCIVFDERLSGERMVKAFQWRFVSQESCLRHQRSGQSSRALGLSGKRRTSRERFPGARKSGCCGKRTGSRQMALHQPVSRRRRLLRQIPEPLCRCRPPGSIVLRSLFDYRRTRELDYLQHVKDDSSLDELVQFDGGQESLDAIRNYLNKYGMRCAGEIDIAKPRWSEKPTTLVPMILANINNCEPNASHLKFEQGRQEALDKEQEVLERLKQLPDGEQNAKETKRMIGLVRNLSGYREYPKYGIVSRYFVYKHALLKEAERLVQANVIREPEDSRRYILPPLRGASRRRTHQ